MTTILTVNIQIAKCSGERSTLNKLLSPRYDALQLGRHLLVCGLVLLLYYTYEYVSDFYGEHAVSCYRYRPTRSW